MFGTRKEKPLPQAPKFETPEKPGDELLPDLPELKTWFFLDQTRNRDEYTGTHLEVSDGWATVLRITGYRWTFAPYGGVWCSRKTVHIVASVRMDGIHSYGLVETS